MDSKSGRKKNKPSLAEAWQEKLKTIPPEQRKAATEAVIKLLNKRYQKRMQQTQP